MKMLEKRKAQGLSITTIVIAVLGLIILIVIIAILTGRLGLFGIGLDEAKTCESLCTVIAKDTWTDDDEVTCKAQPLFFRYFSGTFGDVPIGNVCCCLNFP